MCVCVFARTHARACMHMCVCEYVIYGYGSRSDVLYDSMK